MLNIQTKKEILITKLVENDIALIMNNDKLHDHWYIGTILEKGFCGYSKYSFKELVAEAKDMGVQVESFDIYKHGKI